MDRQDDLIPEHPNNSNIRCSPQDKRCIQKSLARHPSKSTNQRSNSGREETKAVLVREKTYPRNSTKLGNPLRLAGGLSLQLYFQSHMCEIQVVNGKRNLYFTGRKFLTVVLQNEAQVYFETNMQTAASTTLRTQHPL